MLGVGLGSPRDAEFEAFGEEADDRRRAQRLDEALEVLTGLWSGEWFAHSGEHYALDEMRFLPKPAQDRIPVWIGGNWPNRRPFRRAARWDGVVPERVDGELPTPADVRDVLAFIAEERNGSRVEPERPFDVVIGGITDAADAAGREITSRVRGGGRDVVDGALSSCEPLARGRPATDRGGTCAIEPACPALRPTPSGDVR